MKKKQFFILAFLTTLISSFLLVSGSSILLIPLLKSPEFPLGTLTTWLGFIALPLTFYLGLRQSHSLSGIRKFVKTGYLVLVISGILWGFVGFYLAKNWGFNFSPQNGFRGSPAAGRIYGNINYSLFVAPFILAIILIIELIFSKISSKN